LLVEVVVDQTKVVVAVLVDLECQTLYVYLAQQHPL
jgi:hypothetical protein